VRNPGVKLVISAATAEELRQHEAMLELVQKSSGGKALWWQAEPPNGDGTHKNH
jgi:hypothetical protein